MKQLLIATAALSMIGGAAFAQTTAATPGAYASPGSTQGAQAGTDTATGTNDANAQSVTNGGTASTQTMPAPVASGTDASTSTTTSSMASNAPTGSAPATYPVCTSKHEDRCVNRSQSTRMASNGTHMRMRHMKSMSSSTTTTDATPATTTPGL